MRLYREDGTSLLFRCFICYGLAKAAIVRKIAETGEVTIIGKCAQCWPKYRKATTYKVKKRKRE